MRLVGGHDFLVDRVQLERHGSIRVLQALDAVERGGAEVQQASKDHASEGCPREEDASKGVAID